MNEASKTSIQIGPGLLGCLTIVFVIAKLTGHLDWSWWWVFAPLWGPWVLVLGFLVVAGVIAGVFMLVIAIAEYATRPKRLPRRRP
jgi:hypothetical protein